MSARRIVVVDVESNGLDPAVHQAVEVAWHDMSTGDHGCFVPRHDVQRVLAESQVRALQINRYVDRLAEAAQDVEGHDVTILRNVLDGATLAGSNPSFDAAMLRKVIHPHLIQTVRLYGNGTSAVVDRQVADPWHHRLLDLSAYAAGVLGVSPSSLPGLATVCELLDLPPGDHTAAGDVAATVACFKALMAKAGVTPFTEGAAT